MFTVASVWCGTAPVRGEGGRGGAESSRRGQPSPFTLHNTAAQVSGELCQVLR